MGVKIPQFVKPSKPCSIRVCKHKIFYIRWTVRLNINLKLIFYSPTYLSVSLSLCLCLSLIWLPISLSLQSRMPQTLSPSLFPNCRNATILLSLFSFATDLSRMVAARWWREGCGLWVRWVMGFMAWVSAGLWGGPMVVARWWHGYGSWLCGQTLNIKSSSHSLILSALGFHKWQAHRVGSFMGCPDLSLCWLCLGWPDLCLGGWINGGLVFGWLWVGVLVAGLVFGWVFCCCGWLFGCVWWWSGGCCWFAGETDIDRRDRDWGREESEISFLLLIY